MPVRRTTITSTGSLPSKPARTRRRLAEVGHRAKSVCLLGLMAMHTDRPRSCDPASERFSSAGADEANKGLARPKRAPYNTDAVMAKAGLA